MAFNISKRLGNEGCFVQEWATPNGSEAFTLGEALVFSSGAVTKCGATATPEAIALASYPSTASPAVNSLPILRITEDMEFETKSVATVASSVVGSKVTLHTDGLQITATTTSGVFEVSSTDGATTNSTVRGYFRR